MSDLEDPSQENITGMVTAPGVDTLIGVVLDGRFKIIEPIGSGGMGRVYKAVQAPLNRAVALKVLDYNYGPGREQAFRQRFLVEAALTAKLNHPNTVTVIDYGCTPDGIFWIAMEFLEGETLEALLKSKRALPWRRLLTIGQQVARSLREAHNLGVVHRDLKPANVMLLNADDDHDTVKVLDFGLVKSFVEGEELEGRAVTQQGMLMGSPMYMAPEQGENNVADPRSDIYSLGIIMYEALTGSPPFKGNNAMQVILDHVHKPVPPMRTPPHLEPPPPHLVALVNKCLAKSPMDRFQSMEEVLASMQELASPERFLTPGKGTQAPARRGFSRVVTIGLFIVAAALGSVVTALIARSGSTVEPEPQRARPAETRTREPEPARPVPAGNIVFHIDSVPSGATVTMGARKMGITPVDFELGAGPDGTTSAEVHLEMAGYVSQTVTAGGSGPRIEVMQRLQLLPPEKVVEKVVVEKVLVPAPSPPPVAPPPAHLKKKHGSASKLDERDFDMPTMSPPSKGDTLKKPK